VLTSKFESLPRVHGNKAAYVLRSITLREVKIENIRGLSIVPLLVCKNSVLGDQLEGPSFWRRRWGGQSIRKLTGLTHLTIAHEFASKTGRLDLFGDGIQK
jgi:hypothetical protein